MCRLQCFVFVVLIQLLDIVSGWTQFFDCNPSTVWPLTLSTSEDVKIEDLDELYLSRCELPGKRKIVDIAEGIYADNIKILTLEFTPHLTLWRENFAGFKNLITLNLPRNELYGVYYDVLHDLKNLSNLNLEENHILELPAGFLNLDNLSHLNVQNNRLKVIERKTFEKCEKLEELYLGNNELVKIEPQSFEKLKLLQWLYMQKNNLQTLPEDIFAELENLEEIDLSQNNFSNNSLPERLFKNNKFLRKVYLFGNRQNLTTLPSKFFANLTELTTVEIGSNKIVHLPEDLFEGSVQLQNLSMMSNDIQKLPRHIFKDCKELLWINLSFNKLRELPDGVFSTLVKLEQLDLSNNYITTLNETIFKDLRSLKVLNMERNGLTLKSNHNIGISRSPVHFCNNIEELHLASNNISEIFFDWRMAAYLRTLDLKDNSVESLDIEDMLFSSKELNVDLSFNQIERISLAKAEESVEKVSKEDRKDIIISLGNNPINCDCYVNDLIRFQEGHMSRYVYNNLQLNLSNLICQKPRWLRKKPVKNLTTSEIFRCQ